MGIKERTTFLRTKPMPIRAPSPLTYIMPANSVINTPETKKASDKIWRFTARLWAKKPFDQITRKAISTSIPTQIP